MRGTPRRSRRCCTPARTTSGVIGPGGGHHLVKAVRAAAAGAARDSGRRGSRRCRSGRPCRSASKPASAYSPSAAAGGVRVERRAVALHVGDLPQSGEHARHLEPGPELDARRAKWSVGHGAGQSNIGRQTHGSRSRDARAGIHRLANRQGQLAARGRHGAPYAGEAAIDDMRRFVEAGITLFDCADHYVGVEQLIGEFRRRHPSMRAGCACRPSSFRISSRCRA